MVNDWKSARFTKKLPVLSVTPELYAATHDYADKHSMKLAEVMRKALSLFLASESSKSISENTKSISENSRPVKKAKKGSSK